MIIVVIFLIMFLSNSTIAAVVVSADKIELLPYCKHTLLEAGRYNVEEIVKFPEKQWTKSTRKNLSLGFKNDKELWIQCKLINDKDRAQKIVLETDNPNTNYINMYLFKEEGVVAQRAYKKVNYYFDMELEPKESKVVYLKFYSPISTLKAYPVLWTPNTFLN
ncbi:MAG: hypothetical protein L3J42_02785, partial [Hydrogenimonas sp.]|nr:hypothetical protein [Hydrogenimonas sp.]